MNKKYFVLMLLSLALSSQFSLAATVDGVNPNTSAELKIMQSQTSLYKLKLL